MDYTTLTAPVLTGAQGNLEAKEGMHSLYEALQVLPDPRRGQGKRYSLALLLCLLVLAKLAGQTTLSGATEWIRHRAQLIAEHFSLSRKQMPCQMTYCRILACIDPQKLDEVLAAFFVRWEAEQRCGDEPSRLHTPACQLDHAHLAIDGKTVRATSKEEHPVHLLSCYDVTTGTVLWQCNVKDKENEISALKPLLTPTLVTGRIFSLDAMHTQRLLCGRIHWLGGDYVLTAKDNQPTLREDIADLFEDPTPDRRRWQSAQTWDKGHGRLEHRQITCSPDLNEWFGKDWAGIEQVFRIERTIRTIKTGAVHHEVAYGLSSLSLRQAPPVRMLALIRNHWAIENRLHWRRDVTLREDHCQVRKGDAPRVLANLNSFLFAMIDFLGVRNVAQQTRLFDTQPLFARRLLLASLLTFK